MATIAAASPGGGDVSVRMPAAGAAASREGEDGDAPNANPEMQLSLFVRYVAFGEWAGNAFGGLAFLWATGVLLGGFCHDLNGRDFWFATVMIFIEAFRIFSRSYKLDSQSLFGTTRALRWTNSSFLRMLGRPQEGNAVVLILGFWLNLIYNSLFEMTAVLFKYWTILLVQLILTMAVFVTWIRHPQRPKQWQIRAAAIAYVLATAQKLVDVLSSTCDMSPEQKTPAHKLFIFCMLPLIIEDVAVLLVILRPRRIANLTSTPFGSKLISLAKVISALWLANERLDMLYRLYLSIPLPRYVKDDFCQPFALLVLSLGSLQNHAAEGGPMFGRWSWTDAIMHISYLFYSVVSAPMNIVYDNVTGLSNLSDDGLSCMLLLVFLLSGNLQIPAAVAQIVLSSLRLVNLLVAHIDYNPLPSDFSHNMVPAIAVFYVLALCQGSLYIMASFLGLLSTFPRRWLMQRSKLGGKLGAKAIDLYYEHAYATRMEMGMFGEAGRTGSFADFAMESLSSSSSRDLQVAGLCVLHNMLQQRRDCNRKDLTLRVTSSSTVVSTLVGMLAWTDMEDDGSYLIIRLFAARVTAELANSLRISSIPGMLKLVSSLLELAENADAVVLVPNQLGHGHQQTPLAIANGAGSVQLGQGSSNGRWCSWAVFRYWQRMKEEYWSIPEEPTLSDQDSPPVLGMVILEKLAHDLDNCVEIFKDDTTNLISKTIGIIGLATSENQKNDDALVCSALKFLRRLATTGERIGASLRHELWNHPFLLTCLARVLEDDSNDGSPQLWEPAMDIIAKLALDRAAGLEIGKIQVITARLLRHAFLGRQGSTNMYYDQSLRKVSGETLANLALWGTANCSAILEVINDLMNMLLDDNYRYVAASLLLNICAHCSVNLLLSHPHAREHLSSALTTVMEHMMAAEGKQLESLISLASGIGDVMREAFARELESQTNSGAELVQKLVCTLNSKKIPNPEYPRMRRFIVKILISILESCHSTVEKLMEAGMMERLKASLTKIERSPSRVEEYRVFYGNIEVVLEDGEPMSTLVARAKALVQHTTQSAAGPMIGGSFMIPHPWSISDTFRL